MRQSMFITVGLAILVFLLGMAACNEASVPSEPEEGDQMAMEEEEHDENSGDSEGEDHEMAGGEHTMDSAGESSMVAITLIDTPEYTMTPDTMSVGAGTVMFTTKNDGLIEHELQVVKLLEHDLDLTNLPVVDGMLTEQQVGMDTFIVDADGNQLGQVIGGHAGHESMVHIGAGETEERSVDLAAGEYMLLCNIETHYQLGMWSEFAVA